MSESRPSPRRKANSRIDSHLLSRDVEHSTHHRHGLQLNLPITLARGHPIELAFEEVVVDVADGESEGSKRCKLMSRVKVESLITHIPPGIG